MRNIWSFETGRALGVTVRIHFTWLVLFLWIVIGNESRPPSEQMIVAVALFASVLVHEISKIFAGRFFGVGTQAVTLYPFGGVARLAKTPSLRAEFAMATAGPLANGFIALILVPFSNLSTALVAHDASLPLLEQLMLINGALSLFNLLPALPLDGGRIVKCILRYFGSTKPTRVLSSVTQVISLAMAVTAFFVAEPILFLGAFVIFFGALQDFIQSESRTAAIGFVAGDAMIPCSRLESFTHGTTVSAALKVALTSLQPLYPIQIANELVGVVFRESILEHAANEPNAYLADISVPSIESVEVDAPLTEALARFENLALDVLVVRRSGEFVGLLIQERVAEFVIMKSLEHNRKNNDDVPWSVPM